MRKRYVAMLTLLTLAMAVMASGCGSNESDRTTETASETETVSQESSTESGVEVLHFVSAHGDNYVVGIRDDWQKHSYELNNFLHDGDLLSYEDDNYTYRLGVDVSKFQGSVDWEKVKAAGYDFAFIRAGFRGYGETGSLNEDPMAISNIKGAKAAGLDIGVYFYSQAINEDEAVEEAEYTMNILNKAGVGPEDLSMPIVYDPESVADDEARTNDVTGAQFTNNTIAFCQAVEEAGYDSMIYCNMLWEAYKLNLGKLKDYKVWYADYEEKPQTPYQFSFWQYSEEAAVDGISGNVDVDIWLIEK